MYLVTARGKQASVSVAVHDAAAALRKVRELQADGLTAIVFDTAGRERSLKELEASAREDAR